MARRKKNTGPAAAKDGERRVWTVTELTRAVKSSIEKTFGRVWVAGEISNLRTPQSGHVYLTLKDEGAQLAVVVFRSTAERLRFKLADGLAVVLGGQMTVYEARGNYQVIATSVEPRGVGALELAFKQLVERLRGEGLFDEEHKVPLPRFPRRVAVVTSRTGAAVRDIVQTALRRFPGLHLSIYSVRVQGEGAAVEIADAIRHLNRIGGFDVIIAGRGGGSLEDLWAFNEEVVARAIYDSEIPIVSAVGHEIDVTVADLVADVRAATPTAAAELVVPRREDIEADLLDTARRLRHALQSRLETTRAELRGLGARLGPLQLRGVVRQKMQRVDDFGTRMGVALVSRVRAARSRADGGRARMLPALRALLRHSADRLRGAGAQLDSLSPLKVLERGYSITRLDGRVVRSAGDVRPGDALDTILRRGRIKSRVESVEKDHGEEKEG